MTAKRLVILDRDGVINEDSDAYIKSVDEWRPLPGSIEAIARLSQGGYHVCVVSNQSGLARGLFTIDDLNAMHQRLHELLNRIGGQVDAIFFCPHGPDQGCNCRKPRPGLLLAAAKRWRVEIVGTPFIGDSPSDIQVAQAVGAQPILVQTGKGARTLQAHPELADQGLVFTDLAAAADHLLGVAVAPNGMHF